MVTQFGYVVIWSTIWPQFCQVELKNFYLTQLLILNYRIQQNVGLRKCAT